MERPSPLEGRPKVRSRVASALGPLLAPGRLSPGHPERLASQAVRDQPGRADCCHARGTVHRKGCEVCFKKSHLCPRKKR